MLSKEQIIENMARAIYNERPNITKVGSGGLVKVTIIPFEESGTTKSISKIQAEAALNALIDSLPSDKIDINDSRPNLIYKPAWTAQDYYRYYRQLLNMKG